MTKTDKPVPQRPSRSQWIRLADGYQPKREIRGYQPTSQNNPSKPPSNPPNQGTSGKK